MGSETVERCRTERGHFIPGCMGAAAAGGDRYYCTCPHKKPSGPTKAELIERIVQIEKALADLKVAMARPTPTPETASMEETK